VVPEGSLAGGGIGCHSMALTMDRQTVGLTQMGGEGVHWVGAAPFSGTAHVFQNLGDGTFAHSGSLAIRQAVAAGTNITFKILYNGTVAMTGGQSAAGAMTVPALTRMLEAEGVGRILVLADRPDKHPRRARWAPAVQVCESEPTTSWPGSARSSTTALWHIVTLPPRGSSPKSSIPCAAQNRACVVARSSARASNPWARRSAEITSPKKVR